MTIYINDVKMFKKEVTSLGLELMSFLTVLSRKLLKTDQKADQI